MSDTGLKGIRGELGLTEEAMAKMPIYGRPI